MFFKYSSQTRSGPINGKSFFDDGEICHVGHRPHIEIDETKKWMRIKEVYI